MGLIPGGAYNNRKFRGPFVDFAPSVPQRVQDVLFDPQTSGGLLIAVVADSAADLLQALRGHGVDATLVGEVITSPGERIVVE